MLCVYYVGGCGGLSVGVIDIQLVSQDLPRVYSVRVELLTQGGASKLFDCID